MLYVNQASVSEASVTLHHNHSDLCYAKISHLYIVSRQRDLKAVEYRPQGVSVSGTNPRLTVVLSAIQLKTE